MGVRNCQELGENLQKIVERLMANDNLVNLLYYTNKDPLKNPVLSEEQKRKEVFEELIKIVPKVYSRDDARSVVAVRIISGTSLKDNGEFDLIKIGIEVFVPINQWIIKDTNLRPFAILGEIEKSLKGKTVNGLGRIAGGNFELSGLTEEMSVYEQIFQVVQYD